MIHEAVNTRTLPERSSWPPVRPEVPQCEANWRCRKDSDQACPACKEPSCEDHREGCEICGDVVCVRCITIIHEQYVCDRCRKERK
jgi:hypothetical protein